MDAGAIVAVVTAIVVGPVASGIGVYFWARQRYNRLEEEDRKARLEASRKEHADQIGAWKDIRAAQSDEFRRKSREWDEKFARQEREIHDLRVAHAKCEADHFMTKAEVEVLKQGMMARHGDEMVAPFAVITANKEGSIIDASGATTLIFGWRPAQLVNRSVDDLLGSSLVERHRTAFALAMTRKSIKRGNETTIGSARHKQGYETPVVVKLDMLVEDDEVKEVVATVFSQIAMPKRGV